MPDDLFKKIPKFGKFNFETATSAKILNARECSSQPNKDGGKAQGSVLNS
jgi:hypothetical protein